MQRDIDVLSERNGYRIVEVSERASGSDALGQWIEIIRPNGTHVPCASIEAAEELIDAELHPRPSVPAS